MARKSPGVSRFLSAMRKLAQEVNDHEICRRLDIIMQSEKEDFAPAVVKRLLDDPLGFDPDEVKDPYVQYVRHYIYMVKRDVREKESQAASSTSPTKGSTKQNTPRSRKTRSAATKKSSSQKKKTASSASQ